LDACPAAGRRAVGDGTRAQSARKKAAKSAGLAAAQSVLSFTAHSLKKESLMSRKKPQELHHLLDEHQRLKRWPSRRALRLAALAYLASKLRDDQTYTEAAINSLLRHWCAFDDPALLRRELFDWRFVDRTRDGSAYRRLAVSR
jgi:hypothetical protein